MNSPVTTEIEANALTVAAGGSTLWRYEFGARRRPFIHPLATMAGHVLTVDAPDDHPWHHGVWFTIKFVNEENFWEEYDEYGVLRHRGTPTVETEREPSAGDRVSITGDIDWIRPDRETVVIREARRWTHQALDEHTYALDLETSLIPAVDVVLDRTPFTTWGGYGGLAFRGRPDFRDTRILLADGTVTDRVEGVPGDWLDLSGIVDGHDVGIAIIDAPDNPSHPVPWYGSTRHETYGADDQWSNFFNAAFLFHASREVAAGSTLRFRYRVVVHDGIGELDRLAALAADYYRSIA